MKDTNTEQPNEKYTITPEGSLGLLAFGDLGLRAWREVRNKSRKENETNEKK